MSHHFKMVHFIDHENHLVRHFFKRLNHVFNPIALVAAYIFKRNLLERRKVELKLDLRNVRKTTLFVARWRYQTADSLVLAIQFQISLFQVCDLKVVKEEKSELPLQFKRELDDKLNDPLLRFVLALFQLLTLYVPTTIMKQLIE